MATGLEMMFGTLLKSMGFDRAVVEEKATALYNDANFRFHALEAQLSRVEQKLDLILQHIPPTTEGDKNESA